MEAIASTMITLINAISSLLIFVIQCYLLLFFLTHLWVAKRHSQVFRCHVILLRFILMNERLSGSSRTFLLSMIEGREIQTFTRNFPSTIYNSK